MPESPSETLLDAIPEPDTVRGWLAESIRRSAILRSLLRTAQRKAELDRRNPQRPAAKAVAHD